MASSEGRSRCYRWNNRHCAKGDHCTAFHTEVGFRTYFRPYQTLKQTLVHLKDHTPPQQRTGVVYRIPCGTCTKVYIGQTGRTLEHRLKEHRRALVSGQSSLSAVVEHAMEEMHDIDWMGDTVVDGHPHFHQRCSLEAWHIRSQDSTMNRDAGIFLRPCQECQARERKNHAKNGGEGTDSLLYQQIKTLGKL